MLTMNMPSSGRSAERGNVLIITFLLVTLLTALATAHFATVQKNSRQGTFYTDLCDLHRYSETGVRLALHEMTYDVGGADGKIGTELWTAGNDVGRDGLPGTGDEGEGDGIPTPGEPNVFTSPIGPAALGMGLCVYTTNTAWPNVKRIVSTASNRDTLAVTEVYTLSSPQSMPSAGAVYVQPDVLLDLNGNAFRIDGHDHNPNNTVGPAPTVAGIATSVGSPPRSNKTALVNQVPLNRQDQIIGTGPIPSITESGAIDFDALFNAFKASRTNVVTPGTYSNVSTWGDYATNNYKVTYCNGDLHLTGTGKGAGILVVEGQLTMSGTFDFTGIVIVRGDVRMTGGGSGVHIFGNLLIGTSLTALDPDLDLTLSGTADLYYSSVGIAKAMSMVGATYTILYWNEIK